MSDKIVQKQATEQDVIDAHIAGKGGYEIAEQYGLDTEKVKEIIRDADKSGKFIPDGVEPSVDKVDKKK